MKHIHLIPLFTIAALPLTARADEHKHKENDKHKHESRIEVKIPETGSELWKQIDAHVKALGAIVSAKTGETHVEAETVEALLAAVPGKSPGLDGDRKKRVEGQAKNAARALDHLHEEADAGHWDDAAKKLRQVEAAIKIIRGQVGG